MFRTRSQIARQRCSKAGWARPPPQGLWKHIDVPAKDHCAKGLTARSFRSGRQDQGAQRHAQRPGHAIQPAGDRFPVADRRCFLGQDKKCCLESILRVLLMAQHLPAYIEHERPMRGDQLGERGLIACRREALHQLPIRQRDGGPAQTTNVTQQNGRVHGSHDADSPNNFDAPLIVSDRGGENMVIFLEAWDLSAPSAGGRIGLRV